jgi:hypothetical protein
MENVLEEASSQYTLPVTLQYESCYTKEIFEIGPIENWSDITLAYWWIVRHGALYGVTEEHDIL